MVWLELVLVLVWMELVWMELVWMEPVEVELPVPLALCLHSR